MKKFFSLLLFFGFILVSFSQDKKVIVGSESGLNTNSVIELNKQLSILASGDDELISQTITNLAKTGDTRLEEFFAKFLLV